MAKIGCLKPFRGSYNNMKNIVLENGELGIVTDSKRIYIGNGTNTVEQLTPLYNYSIHSQYRRSAWLVPSENDKIKIISTNDIQPVLLVASTSSTHAALYIWQPFYKGLTKIYDNNNIISSYTIDNSTGNVDITITRSVGTYVFMMLIGTDLFNSKFIYE